MKQKILVNKDTIKSIALVVLAIAFSLSLSAALQYKKEVQSYKNLYMQEVEQRAFCSKNDIAPCEGFMLEKWDREHPNQKFYKD